MINILSDLQLRGRRMSLKESCFFINQKVDDFES
jgi:hypothetical protein